MSIHDTTKLCCGPFCAECALVMEKADETIDALRAENATLAKLATEGSVTMAKLESALTDLAFERRSRESLERTHAQKLEWCAKAWRDEVETLTPAPPSSPTTTPTPTRNTHQKGPA